MKTYVRYGSERGAVLIQTAIAILSLTAFSAFVLDYGVLWVSRNQAQNAADAGALAGAIARGLDELSDPPSTGGKAELSAKRTALCASGSANCPSTPDSANPVWASQAGAASGVEVLWTCPPTYAGRCVTVNVYRDGTNGGSTLPTYFGKLLGISSQGIRATASARIMNGNAVNCMRPFSVADRWIENMGSLTAFNRYDSVGDLLAGIPDRYMPPTSTSAGSGLRLPDDVGAAVVLKQENISDPISPGWSLPVRLPDRAVPGTYLGGADDYREAIISCKSDVVKIGDYLPLETGSMTGPTRSAVEGPLSGTTLPLIAQDPGASFNTSTKTISGSCAPGACPNPNGSGPSVMLQQSPRIVPISVFDLDEFSWRLAANAWKTEVFTDGNGTPRSLPGGTCPTNGKCIRVVNILGFYVSYVTPDNKGVGGYLMTIPGLYAGGGGIDDNAAFLRVFQLIR
jgi:Flp pilus assembly protein TadG